MSGSHEALFSRDFGEPWVKFVVASCRSGCFSRRKEDHLLTLQFSWDAFPSFPAPLKKRPVFAKVESPE